jgi:hypothetical protein
MLIDKEGVNRRYIDVYDLDKDNEIGIELGDENNSGLVYLTIEEVKQVIEHLQKQIKYTKVDTGAGFQGENQGDGLSGFRG